jgi:hypothetical protein
LQVRFVVLHFTELGGDHLDRLVNFVTSNHDMEMLKKSEAIQDEAFWKDMHEASPGYVASDAENGGLTPKMEILSWEHDDSPADLGVSNSQSQMALDWIHIGWF